MIQTVKENRVKAPAAKAIGKLSRDLQKKVASKDGAITAADVKAVAPAPEKKVQTISLRDAVRTLLDELDAQKIPAAMVMPFDIHRDTLHSLREAL